MPAPQNYSNHHRTDPPMHFFVFPVLIANVGVAIWIAIHFRHQYPWLGHWSIVVALALLVLATKCRINDLKLQDRLIRLEERLRLSSLLPANELTHLSELTTKQLVALRFASDEEIPALVHKTLTQNLEPKAIKQSITHWRADYERV
ncbi:DUF6526 family protein [Edaphobacter albus]|uniref:DUF6526 family protein n=1 Tax=Edaphobacter sp. 4G125 TaxID=2763071 RepID=UPI001646994D|nr:DUF6526 family protein [Edaphobacter sp. 4G125]QNI36133.1 hypothetical protein H7846_14190 [Edaphobacter sp. 4G125]